MKLNTISGASIAPLQQHPKPSRYNIILSGTAKLLAAATALITLSGCMTSPYWNQKFDDHTELIPLQSFTTNKDEAVKFECAKAFHGGLYPSESEATWVLIDTVMPPSQSLKDSFGAKLWGAGIKRVLPASCWRQDPSNSTWYSAVRATQGSTSKFRVFDKAGLECLGRENGKATSWNGWIGKGCEKTYSGSSTIIPYAVFWAES
ncbi:MAG: hypothetical protein ACR2P1_23075 [Pseudomonadales bacterium]